eukprot:TRINITY_DN12425_c0_g1_i1.p1 TRINITY_DN12425_c0_g1~~TRINITY_DN12425_c0_g1_i1.p1  ORF type:complete len:304 (+),score=38.97 TRINITY_DN12425_c0_g1_i1:103-1014(+)
MSCMNTDSVSARRNSIGGVDGLFRDKQCSLCKVKLGLLKKKHNCFKCASLHCAECSNQIQIPKYGHKTPVRYCAVCFVDVCVELEDRTSISRMSMKDLKRFCSQKTISISHCLDTQEVANAIVAHLKPHHVAVSAFTSSSSFQEQQSQSSPSSSSPIRSSPPENRTSPNSPSRSSGSPSYPSTPLSSQFDRSPSSSRLEDLPVSQLKLILMNNGIDFSDCFEKAELLAKIDKFCPHVRGATTSEKFEVPEKDLCTVCMERRIDCVLLECGHLAVCFICSKHLSECPICRQKIVRVVHTYHVNK